MRSDVLNLILGWTLLALLVPLGLCGIITAFSTVGCLQRRRFFLRC